MGEEKHRWCHDQVLKAPSALECNRIDRSPEEGPTFHLSELENNPSDSKRSQSDLFLLCMTDG